MDDQPQTESVIGRREKFGRLEADIKRFSFVRVIGLGVLLLTLPTTVILVQQRTHPGTSAQTNEVKINTQLNDSGIVNGDLNGDVCVDFADFRILTSLFGKKVVVGLLGDLNGDGKVTISDLGVWLKHYGQGCLK